jgi:hypothetical protein
MSIFREFRFVEGALGLALFGVLGAIDARADTVAFTSPGTLPAPRFIAATLGGDDNIGSIPQTSELFSSVGSESAVTSASPDPSAEAMAVDLGVPDTSQSAQAYIQYYFAIVGPSITGVPVTISVNGSTGGTGNYSATAQVNLETANSNFLLAILGDAYSPTLPFCPDTSIIPCPNTFDVSKTVTLASNISGMDTLSNVYELALGATAGVGVQGTATASVDPSIIIDPTFPDASEYSILVDPGLGNPGTGNTSPTPEPSAVGSLVIIFAGIAFARLKLNSKRLAEKSFVTHRRAR